MQPTEVDVPRSIMDPVPPAGKAPRSRKKLIVIIIIGVIIAVLIGTIAFLLVRGSQTSNQEAALAPEPTPVTTPTPSLQESSTVKQVAVEGRTFTHIVPKDWRTAQSEGDLVSAPFEIPANGGAEPWLATAALRYNQGVYALKPPTATTPVCGVIVADSESVQVSPNDERFINYCGNKDGAETVFAYVLFSKFSYKQGRTLSAAEQTDLVQNALLYGRIVPDENETAATSYANLKAETTFNHMIEILRSITYVQTQ